MNLEKVVLAIIVLIVTTFTLCNLLPYVSFDAASYYYGGLLVAHGQHPYLDFVDNKNPGIYFLLAAPALIGDWNPQAALILFRALELLWFWMIWRLALRTGVGPLCSALATCACCLAYHAMISGTFETIYTELPAAVLITAALLFSYSPRGIFACGACCGLAFIFRQSAAVEALGVLVWLMHYNTAPLNKKLTLFGLGSFAPVFAFGALATQQGWLMAWYQQAFVAAGNFVSGFDPFYVRLAKVFGQLFGNDFFLIFGATLVFWPIAALLSPRMRSITIPLFALVACAGIECAGPGILFRHHFIALLPALTIVLSSVLESLLERTNKVARTAIVTIVLALLLNTTFNNYTAITARFNNLSDRAASEELGAWLQTNVKADEEILVWGFAPQIYLTAQRFAASRHFQFYMLTNQGALFAGPGYDLIGFAHELLVRQPRIIIQLSKIDPVGFAPEIATLYIPGELQTQAGPIKYLKLSS